jgi:hypothetical protein
MIAAYPSIISILPMREWPIDYSIAHNIALD